VLSKIFLTASKIGELFDSYQEYPAQSVGKKGVEFLIAALEKSKQDCLSEI
jgi:phage I-like protein